MSYNAVPPPGGGGGGVDFAAALNKAKAIAAQLSKGGSPDAGGAGSKRSRSQERGDDDHSSKRERYDDAPPPRPAAAKFGLGSEERSVGISPFAAAGANIQEEFHVPNNVVGMIIGRGGENLKRIETDSRARVQFDPAHQPGDAERRVTVSGSQENVRAAKDMIMRVVEEESERKTMRTAPQMSAPYTSGGADYGALLQTGGVSTRHARPDIGPSSRVFSMTVPKSSVGQIIGRGGETVRELSSRSGARIDVTPESMADPMSMERTVTIQGNEDAIERARGLIDDIVNSMPPPRSGGSYGPPGGGGFGGGGGGGPPQETEIIEVPSQYVGSIIGRGGSEIKALEREAGCRIIVAPPGTGGPNREVTLTGTPDRVAFGKKLVNERIAEAASNVGGRSRDYSRDNAPGGPGGFGGPPGGGFGQQQGYGQDQFYGGGGYGAQAAPAYDPAYSAAFYSDPKNVEAYWAWYAQTYPVEYAAMYAAAAAGGAMGTPTMMGAPETPQLPQAESAEKAPGT